MSARLPFGRLAGALAGLGVLAGAGAVAALRRPLPRTTGSLCVPGLGAKVEVIRDRWGVPHIYARSDEDLFRAQGFVHAQDRLWQMEFQRRLGHGRLSELFGQLAVDTDRFVRILGFSRVAQAEAARLQPHVFAVLAAYVAGINAFVEQNQRRLPIEFTLLRVRPEPWQIADVLVWSKIMALSLSENWTDELMRARLVAAFGPERASDFLSEYPRDHPLIVPPGVAYSADMGQDALDMAEAAAPFVAEGQGQGSNNWVVAGHRSATGMPLLANDPHLAIAIPSIWYENHLSGGSYHVAGASFPGAPGVVIGHNERIAWGVTNSMTDVQDLYIERFHAGDRERYEFQGQWELARTVREEIRVRDQAEPVVEDVRLTRHGPIISAFVPSDDAGSAHADEALALRWTALEPGYLTQAVLDMNRAQDWAGFRAALANWTCPGQNFVYADVEGHIGYALGGAIPIRAQGDGRLPVPGWSGEYEWLGMVPNDALPHAFDPEDGILVSANNRIVGPSFPYKIEGEYLSGYRAARIRQLLEQTPQHTADTFGRIHRDARSLAGLELVALVGRLPIDTPFTAQVRDVLATWDGDMSPDSAGALIFNRLRERLLDDAFHEIEGVIGAAFGLGAFAGLPGHDMKSGALPGILRRIAERDDSWFGGRNAWDTVLAECWRATVMELRDRYGDDPTTWRYGDTHKIHLRHALGSIAPLAPLLNRGPFEYRGDRNTVSMGHAPKTASGQEMFVAPSYRQICDTADWNRSRSIHPVGQSGHPGSAHYADFIEAWLEGRYHPMPWSRTQVEEAAEARLALEPA